MYSSVRSRLIISSLSAQLEGSCLQLALFELETRYVCHLHGHFPCKSLSYLQNSSLLSNTSLPMSKLWIISTNGLKPDKRQIFSSKKLSVFPIFGKKWAKKFHLVSSWQQEIPQPNSQLGSMFMEVPTHHRNLLIITSTSPYCADWWRSLLQPFSLCLSTMLEEHTTLIRLGQLS
jgi:hypothetical protein